MNGLFLLLYSKKTFIELAILLILCFLLNKIIFLSILLVLIFFIYKSNKKSNIPIPKELENIKMKALLENLNCSSNKFQDMFSFQENITIPPLKNDSYILVKVYSVSLNHIDTLFLFSNIPFVRWFRFSHFGVGSDFSGKIIQTGKYVKNFKKGDEVFGSTIGGAFQEYALTYESRIFKKPDSISHNEASCIQTCFSTAYKSLTYNFNTDVKDKNVLIIGCSGGVGIFAIQIAKYLGFKNVYGICSSKNKEFVKSFGIDEVLCYDKENYIKDCNEKFDLIFDNVHSAESMQYEKYKILLKTNIGKYVVVNGTMKERIFGALQVLFQNKINIFEPKNFHYHFGSLDNKYLEIAANMFAKKKLKVYYQKFIFDKKEIMNGLELIKSRRTKGKLVYEINTV